MLTKKCFKWRFNQFTQLLMLSGVGPEKDLKIKELTLYTLEGVGQNLQDHLEPYSKRM